ncbi:unnamed protein product [Cercopithifilaria johnstoni]|uniref:Uncharacterized protein n=1 Tax=Cercopithifilaria johnstoni TaxID=2874296 RepID=A0A8J2MRZ6_9BILA|nr:unnamed protein product [Cercopithifilaria johnstoni]
MQSEPLDSKICMLPYNTNTANHERVWNSGGIIKYSFRDIKYKGDHLALDFWYNWIKYKVASRNFKKELNCCDAVICSLSFGAIERKDCYTAIRLRVIKLKLVKYRFVFVTNVIDHPKLVVHVTSDEPISVMVIHGKPVQWRGLHRDRNILPDENSNQHVTTWY